jgi:hypothetical protein
VKKFSGEIEFRLQPLEVEVHNNNTIVSSHNTTTSFSLHDFSSGMTDTPSDNIASSALDDEINRIYRLSDEELVRAKGSSKLSGISLSVAKQLSGHLLLNRSHNKSTLLDNIIRKRQRVNELAEIHEAEAEAEDSDTESRKFASNQNTFPRLCNILLDYPDAVVRSAVLATKYSLQNKETNQNQPIFTETRESFNDANFNSGGIVADHPELIRAKIDPEKHNNGKISVKKIFKLFNSVIRQYAFISTKYTASGQHNQHDFFNYCHGNVNALYLHLKLIKLGDPELKSYCHEGADLDG